MSSSPVHGRKAVAPLKLAIKGRRAEDDAPVHGRKAVAPLKLDSLGAIGGTWHAAVHGRKAVAPLKLQPLPARLDSAAAPSTAARPWPH